MNKQESDILNTLASEPFINQRIHAEVSGHSLGAVRGGSFSPTQLHISVYYKMLRFLS